MFNGHGLKASLAFEACRRGGDGIIMPPDPRNRMDKYVAAQPTTEEFSYRRPDRAPASNAFWVGLRMMQSQSWARGPQQRLCGCSPHCWYDLSISTLETP